MEEYKHLAEKERMSEKKNTREGFDHVTLRLGVVCATTAPVGIAIV